ncbi:MAG TPA: class I SAM-dependent methyltransferase [Solirubrobacterales bacterium]|jgi:SAM-dependent methyltransferase|nr:class I SAM-dependent methyltransferase [Solirubrobacterales bacterium]
MTSPRAADGSARQTYDAFASTYDEFNHRYMYERWTGRLLGKAEGAGLEGNRLLDVGCGTGLSFIAMLDRGWQVTACDISPRMLDLARAKVGDAARLLAADMRELPALGEFDLVWAVNDAINYLLNEDQLQAALIGMRQNLAAGGVVLFDVNTLATYRDFFGGEHVVEHNGKRFVWEGQMSAAEVLPGSVNEARFSGAGEGVEPHVHRQRHFTEAEVLAAIDAAGLRCVEVLGELEGDLTPGLDDEVHTKAVYICS